MEALDPVLTSVNGGYEEGKSPAWFGVVCTSYRLQAGSEKYLHAACERTLRGVKHFTKSSMANWR
jgi:hypothetical protein